MPTLVLVDTDSFPEVPPETGRFVANRIPGARLVEHSSAGGSHFHWYARGDAIVAEVARFLADITREEASFDRVLATVLFTDIAGSLRRRWYRVLCRRSQRPPRRSASRSRTRCCYGPIG